MGSFTPSASTLKYQSDGSYGRVDCTIGAVGTYNNTGVEATTGDTLTAASLGLSSIISVTILDDSGYLFEPLGLDAGPASSCRLKIYQGASGTTGSTTAVNNGSVVTGTGTGSAAGQIFTGTAPVTDLNLSSPAFSGTGLTAAGQVITTTDNQTMTLNQCAGMWLISATGATPPNLILSNTAVSGAPAVLTVQGSANTDAGAYKIVKHVTPAGTNTASAVTVSALTANAAAQIQNGHTHSVGAAAGGEVPNGTNLTTPLAAVRVTINGY